MVAEVLVVAAEVEEQNVCKLDQQVWASFWEVHLRRLYHSHRRYSQTFGTE